MALRGGLSMLLVLAACGARLPEGATPAPGAALRSIRAMDIEADAERHTLVAVGPERRLGVVRDGVVARSWPLRELAQRGGCAFGDGTHGYVEVGIAADGAHAWFFGRSGAKGRSPMLRLEVACYVDVESGESRSMQAAFPDATLLRDEALREEVPLLVYVARRRPLALIARRAAIEIVDRTAHRSVTIPMPSEQPTYAVAETERGLAIASVSPATDEPRRTAQLTAIDIDATVGDPRVAARRSIALPIDGLARADFARDGSRLAFVGRDASWLGIVDWSTLAITRVAAGDARITAFDFDHAGARVLVSTEGHLTFYGLDGAARATFATTLGARRLFVTPAEDSVWLVDSEAATLYPIARP